jgi:polyhydroxybutyrate depolymerase
MNKLFTIIFIIIITIQLNAQTYSFMFDGLSRNYIVHLPTGYNSANKYPLVFNLHGYTSDAIQEQFYTQMSTTADNNGFIVVYPNGTPIGTGGNFWNVGFAPSTIDDIGFINALIDTMDSKFSINLNRVYSCGMSNGGYMSYNLACELSDRIAAVASVTGSMTNSMIASCNPTRTVPTMQIHGTTDPTVAYSGSINSMNIDTLVKYWQTKNVCTGTVETTAVPNTVTTDNCTAEFIRIPFCNSGTENWFYKVTNGGHTWPGAALSIPGSNTNMDFNASQRIWDFFNLHTLQGTRTNIGNNIISTLKIYPNPSVDFLRIEGDQLFNVTNVKVLDILGNVVYENNLESQETSLDIDIASLSNGNYILVCTNSNGNSFKNKFAVVK